MSQADGLDERRYKLRRYLRDDCIAKAPQESHSGGYPISHPA